MLDLAEIKVLPGAALEDAEHIKTGCLEMRGCVVALRHEQVVRDAVVKGLVQGGYRHEFLADGPQQVEAGPYLRLRLAGLHGGGHYRHEPALGCHVVRVRHHRHVDV